MVPNTCTKNFIFTYFYSNIKKFLHFKGTPKMHKMDHIGFKTPHFSNFCSFVMQIYCLYYMNIIMVFIFRSGLSGYAHTKYTVNTPLALRYEFRSLTQNLVSLGEISCSFGLSRGLSHCFVSRFEMVNSHGISAWEGQRESIACERVWETTLRAISFSVWYIGRFSGESEKRRSLALFSLSPLTILLHVLNRKNALSSQISPKWVQKSL